MPDVMTVGDAEPEVGSSSGLGDAATTIGA
jgi:hypothetical protein